MMTEDKSTTSLMKNERFHQRPRLCGQGKPHSSWRSLRAMVAESLPVKSLLQRIFGS